MALRGQQLLSSRLTNAVVLAGLALLGYAGHRHHWTIPGGASESEQHDQVRERPVQNDAGDAYPCIRFDSAEAVVQAGIGTAQAIERPLDVVIRSSASVTYDRTRVAQLSPRVAGVVRSVHCRLGQAVRQGDVLALVNAPEVGQARAELLHEFAASAFKTATLKRLRELGNEGAVSERVLREADAAAWEARNRLLAAQQKLINLGFDFQLGDLAGKDPDELARHAQVLGLPEAVIQQLGPRPRAANVMPLCAPFEGVVTRLDWVVGERVTPDQTGLVLADVRRMWLKVAVRREFARRIALGQRVQFTLEGASAPLVEGKIHWISTEIDEKTRTLEAHAEVENAPLGRDDGPRRLRANQYGTATVRIEQLESAVLVPEAAVQRLNDVPLVFLADADGMTFRPRRVELGESRDRHIHIRSGLAAGANVATTNSYVLKSELMRDTLVAGN